MKQVFEYVVIFNPKEDNKAKAKIIVNPTVVLAENKEAASMKAVREIPEEFVNELDSVQVIVRNF